MRELERLGYDPGPIGESHSRLGPLTQETGADPDDAPSIIQPKERDWPGHKATERPPQDEHL